MTQLAIRFDSPVKRLFVSAAFALFLLLGVMMLVWGFARSAALGADTIEIADQLTSLSPADPQTHYSSAVLHEKTFEPGDLETSLREYEEAAARSPNNYLLWLALGTARGRAGDETGAEAALRRAAELAPNYTRVHWALGNFLLRNGEADEAYSRIRSAIEGDPAYAAPAAAIALQMADGDPAAVKARFAGSDPALAAVALQLAKQQRFDESANVWRDVGDVTSSDVVREYAKQLRSTLLDAKRYREAVAVSASLIAEAERPAVGHVTNQSFERSVKLDDPEPFDWHIGPENNPQIGLTNAHAAAGGYSLILVFAPAEVKSLRRLSQLVAVEPGRRYSIGFAYKSDLKAKVRFFQEIVNAADGKRIALSEALEPRAEWGRQNVVFTVPDDADGIEVRLVRGDCYGSECMAAGNIWIDDLSLTAE